MRIHKIEGFVIKRNNFNEADRILTVFSKQSGKVRIKAIGVRRIASRRSPHIELLNLSFLTVYQGKNIPTLIEAETIESFSDIKKNLKKVGFAYHICELIDKLCAENQENRQVFNLLMDILRKLAKEDNIKAAIDEFEINLLGLLGFYTSSQSLIPSFNISSFIENITERKLKSRQFLSKFL